MATGGYSMDRMSSYKVNESSDHADGEHSDSGTVED